MGAPHWTDENNTAGKEEKKKRLMARLQNAVVRMKAFRRPNRHPLRMLDDGSQRCPSSRRSLALEPAPIEKPQYTARMDRARRANKEMRTLTTQGPTEAMTGVSAKDATSAVSDPVDGDGDFASVFGPEI